MSSPNKKPRVAARPSLPTRGRQAVNVAKIPMEVDAVEVQNTQPILTKSIKNNAVGESSTVADSVVVNEDAVIEVSSEENEQVEHLLPEFNETVPVVKVKIEPGLESPNKSEPVIRTRSSSGIVKKRFLKDAAFLSDADDDDELPLNILSPKKTRYAASKVLRLDEEDFGMVDVMAEDHLPATPLPRRVASNTARSSVATVAGDGHGSTVAAIRPTVPVRSSRALKGKVKEDTPMPAFEEEIDEGRRSEDDPDYMNAIEESLSQLRKSMPSTASTSAALPTETNASLGEEDVTFLDSVNAGLVQDTNDNVNDTVEGTSSVKIDVTRSAGVSAGVKPRRTFKDMFPASQTTPMLKAGSDFFDTTMMFKVMSLPRTCEVSDVSLQEPLFVEDRGSLKPWATNAPSIDSKLVNFRQWGTQCPDMDFDVAKDALFFSRYKHFINPSHVDPREVNILYTQVDHKRSVLQCNYKTAICLSPILLAESYLIEPSTEGLMNKYVTGYFHNQEWQRFEGFSCMVFNRQSMTVQTQNNVLAFQTMGPRQVNRDHNQSYSPSKVPRNPDILGAAIPKKNDNNASDSSRSRFGYKTMLDYTDDIPIYDSREHPFNFTTDLDDLDSILPRFDSELPQHSFVVVGYTLGSYERDRRVHLATNIMFAILFGTE